MNMRDVLKESCVIPDLQGVTKRGILSELVNSFKQAGLINNVNEAVDVVLEREKLGSTGIGEGIAIPHGKMKSIDGLICAFGRSRQGVDFDAVDGKPVHIFFLLLAPEESVGLHIQMLSRISRVLRDVEFRKHLIEAQENSDLYSEIISQDEKFGG
jgi:PTS system nitrogen regulatory IIA component